MQVSIFKNKPEVFKSQKQIDRMNIAIIVVWGSLMSCIFVLNM